MSKFQRVEKSICRSQTHMNWSLFIPHSMDDCRKNLVCWFLHHRGRYVLAHVTESFERRFTNWLVAWSIYNIGAQNCGKIGPLLKKAYLIKRQFKRWNYERFNMIGGFLCKWILCKTAHTCCVRTLNFFNFRFRTKVTKFCNRMWIVISFNAIRVSFC